MNRSGSTRQDKLRRWILGALVSLMGTHAQRCWKRYIRSALMGVLTGATVASCGGQTEGAAGAGGGTSADGGNGARLECRELPGPVMAQTGDHCVDTTEVTQAQYAEFLSVP